MATWLIRSAGPSRRFWNGNPTGSRPLSGLRSRARLRADTKPAVLRRAYTGAARVAPGSRVFFLFGAVEASRFRWATALAHYQKVDENSGWAASWDELAGAMARAYHMTDQFEAELAVVREGLLDAPSNRWLRAFEVAGLAIQGRTEEFR